MKHILISNQDTISDTWRVIYVEPHHGKDWHHDIQWDLSGVEAGNNAGRRHALTGYPVYLTTDGVTKQLVTPLQIRPPHNALT